MDNLVPYNEELWFAALRKEIDARAYILAVTTHTNIPYTGDLVED